MPRLRRRRLTARSRVATGQRLAQIALAWLLRRSPAMLPIPGTGSPAHLRENVNAALIELSEDDMLTVERGIQRAT